MPVTAKLSRKFYDQFGEELANELVDWFNKVDETYRAQLRELNDVNFDRFDAKMGERLAELRAELLGRMSDQKADLMRWMFGLWATQMLAIVGLTITLALRP